MAGKFLSLEEAARHLGVTIEEINRLVDRKKLFPMRDGPTVKFKLDELDRVAADTGDEPSASSDLSLDLDLSSPALGGGGAAATLGDDDIVLGDALEEDDSIFGGSGTAADEMPSRTIAGGQGKAKGSDIAVGGEDLVIGDAGSALASSDLELDSIIGASSPSLGGSVARSLGEGDSNVAAGRSGTLEIDLSNLGSGSLAVGSGAGLSGPSPGAALSGALDSGLSLEGSDIKASGIDLGGSAIGAGLGSAIGSGLDGGLGSPFGSGVDAIGGALGGDAFELGDAATDEESASVVISTEETGDSSFFGTVSDESSSLSIDDAGSVAGMVGGGEESLEGAGGPPFSVLQIVGLVCCTLFLLTCSLVMVDLVWSIRAPSGAPISSPLLKALTDTFAWR